MKLTKGRLNQLIKEEIEKVIMKETSDYVQNVLELLKKNMDAETILQEMVNSMSDSEAMESFKFIARNHNINLQDPMASNDDQSHQGQDADQQVQENKETK